jgi:NADH-quinone oxidoreductase subunit L
LVTAAWVCLASPLAGALLVTLLGTRVSRRVSAYLATLSCGVAAVAAAVSFFAVLGRDEEGKRELSTAWTWLTAGDLEIELSIVVDPLSILMMLVVAGVGSLIVGYSIGYMDGEDEERRYFAYMALFVFSMLTLVLAGNYLILLAGWGLVGLCSYLLIGFHHERPSAVAAAKKAFVMNAVGDATMALALFLLIWNLGTLDYLQSFEQVGELSGTVATLVALGLLGGAVAKSAQIPLHTWLPDAMEGPTPVSALIHAATMVTAGVYLIARLHPVFEEADFVQNLAAGLGAVTLLVAGLIALAQVDIKRVIAYSTMSQIGYMFVGVGVGAYASGMFHLMTHAFFKALLFLGAGIVIHALLGEQDIRKMGGLKGLMPRTWIAMLVGGLALAGIPPLSGFFSKDSILASTLARGDWWGYLLFAAGLAGTLLTGIYTFRMLFVVFLGEPSAFVRDAASHGLHGGREGPFSMTSTVAVLAALAAVGGLIQVAGLWHLLGDFLEPARAVGREELDLVHPSPLQDWLTSLFAVALGAAGIFVAWTIYGARRRPAPRQAAIQRALEHKLYFDEAYDVAYYRPAHAIALAFSRLVERPLIEGSIAGLAGGTRLLSGRIGRVQTGYLRTYALAIAGGVALLALVFVSAR